VFAATMLVRAPAYLFQGVAAALLPNLTTMHARRDVAGFRRAIGRTVAILAGASAVAAVGAAAVGPQVMHVLYGPDFDTARVDLALLAAGAGGYLVAGTLSQAALARSQTVRAAVVWIGSALMFVVLELSLEGAALHRVAIAFAVAALANAVAFGALLARERRDDDGEPVLRLASSGA
jgi:O-antigen/teichoic acid export membrane protein